MQSFDKIIIVGDSFCASRHYNDHYAWPVVLGKLLDCTLHGRGHGGVAWWSSKLDLSSFKEDFATTILIVVHTDSYRLPNDHGIPIHSGLLFADCDATGFPRGITVHKDNVFVNDNRKLVETALEFYKSDLFCPRFYEWAQQAWIKELDADTRYHTTIHIPSFDSVDLSCVKNGIVIIPSKDFKSLRALSRHENEKDFMHIRMHDSRSNHFSNFNNVKLANAFASIILKLQPGDTGKRNFDNLHEWEFKT